MATTRTYRSGRDARRDSGRPDPARTERLRAAERRIGAVAHVLDDLVTVPGTGRRFGMDPLLSLVPVLGSATTALVGAWIVGEAARFQLPRVVLVRMVVNVAVDTLLGAIPLVGNVLDFAFKGNARNVALFRRHALDPGASTAGDRAFLLGLLLVAVGVGWIVLTLLGRLLSVVVAGP